MSRFPNTVNVSTLPPRCICGDIANSWAESMMLNDSVLLVIGTCDRHAPRNESETMALVRALLHGIARAGHEVKNNASCGEEASS